MKDVRMKNRMMYLAVALFSCVCMTACSSEVSNIGQAREKEQTGEIGTELTGNRPGAYDSADTAVVSSVNESDETITLHNIKAGRNYTLGYDDTSKVINKHGGALVMEQIELGTIVDVKFKKDSKKLASLSVSKDAWQYSDVSQFDLGRGNSTASIGSAIYHLSPDTPVFSGGETGEFMDIVRGDVISVSGMGNDIYGINVEKGHGYLKLQNDEALIGGWIEVGNEVITTISDNMMLVVPEGTYKVRLYNGDAKADRDITITRNHETDIDCSGIVSPEPKTGYVEFDIDPEDAHLLIDGNDAEVSVPVELKYGIHQITASADGYETVSKYISVGTDMAKLSLKLDKEDSESTSSDENSQESEENAEISSAVAASSAAPDVVSNESAAIQNSTSATTVSGNSSTTTGASTTTSNSVYVDAPKNCSVYLDGTYIGTSPACFTKTTGSHTITFTKSGYVSRTYTVYLYNDGSDITYSFADLVSDGTVSGNT